MQMVGRNASTGDYRYGFNGMEKDDELKGSGNSVDFGARMYDSRLGRWLSRDPHASNYASMSSYLGFGNNPIMFVDPDGKDIVIFGNEEYVQKATTALMVIYATKKGKVMIDEMIGSNLKLQIKDTWWGATYSEQDNRTLRYNTSSTIEIDASSRGDKGGEVDMYHELLHAFEDIMAGKIVEGEKVYESANTSTRETQAVVGANYFRSVIGLENMRTFREGGGWPDKTDRDVTIAEGADYNPSGEKLYLFGTTFQFGEFEESGNSYYDFTVNKISNVDDKKEQETPENNRVRFFFWKKGSSKDHKQRKGVEAHVTPKI
jgi:RHS repeat-associated protein